MNDALLRLQEMARDLARQSPSILIGAIVFLIFYLAANSIRNQVIKLSTARKRPINLTLVLGRSTQIVILLIGTLIAFTIAIPTFTPANLISALGVTGIAVGFAFRDIFENFLAGIIILLTEPFRINDQISVSSYEGVVEDIQIRATIIRTLDGRRVVLPNSDLFKNAVTVTTALPNRQLSHSLHIAKPTQIEAAKQAILAAIGTIEAIQTNPAPSVSVSDLTAAGVRLSVSWWVATAPGTPDTRDLVLSRLADAFREHGIELAAAVAA
jgi:small-conductance mechanosensitive channel